MQVLTKEEWAKTYESLVNQLYRPQGGRGQDELAWWDAKQEAEEIMSERYLVQEELEA